MKTRAQFMARLFDALEAETADAPGVTRASYGLGEAAAHSIFQQEAQKLGCTVDVDAAGNSYATLVGYQPDLPVWMIGSHLDSVPHGGNFDGAAGVIGGLGLIADLVREKHQPLRSVTVAAFRGEEAAWFPISYIGSNAAFGNLDLSSLQVLRSDSGRSLNDHMIEAGFHPEAVASGDAFLKPGAIHRFIEVHIEQGPRLTIDNTPVGIVTAISGGFRFMEGRVIGEWGHSGATPRFARRDASVALSEFIQGLDQCWDRLQERELDATITFGRITSDPKLHGGSRIVGEITFSLDIRSEYPEVLSIIREEVISLTRRIENERAVRIETGPEFTWPIVKMNRDVVDQLSHGASKSDIQHIKMPSGAGHDAAVFAEMGVETGMVFVRNENGSHNPDEGMRIDDLSLAVEILKNTIMQD